MSDRKSIFISKNEQDEVQSMEDLCNSWLEINKSRLKKSSYDKYSAIISKHLITEFGGEQSSEITTERVAIFTDNLLYHKRLAVKTVRDILILLHSILVYECEQSSRQKSPITIIYPKEETKELRVLNQKEQMRVMRYLEEDTDLYKLGVMIAITTGLRVGELCGLRWQDISFEENTLFVRSTVQRVKNSSDAAKKTIVKIGTPKSRNSIRTIPLTSGIMKYCRQLKSANKNSFILTGTSSFAEPRTMQRKLTQYYKDCGITGAHFHTLRHTFATRCIEVGCDIKSLSEILGHSDTSITMNRYVHPNLELKQKNIKKLEDAGFGYKDN